MKKVITREEAEKGMDAFLPDKYIRAKVYDIVENEFGRKGKHV